MKKFSLVRKTKDFEVEVLPEIFKTLRLVELSGHQRSQYMFDMAEKREQLQQEGFLLAEGASAADMAQRNLAIARAMLGMSEQLLIQCAFWIAANEDGALVGLTAMTYDEVYSWPSDLVESLYQEAQLLNGFATPDTADTTATDEEAAAVKS